MNDSSERTNDAKHAGLLMSASLACLGWVLVCLALTGCTYEKVIYDHWAQLGGSKWSDRKPTHRQNAKNHKQSDQDMRDWAILLQSHEGKGGKAKAKKVLDLLKQQSIPDLWIQTNKKRSYLFRGRYAFAGSEEAMRDLRQSRMLPIGDTRPFLSAQLVRISYLQNEDEQNLSQFVGLYAYTLQVAAFDSRARPTRQQAAVQYAQQLRKQGQRAFYYHGATYSLVTVGLFTEDDLVSKSITLANGKQALTQAYGPRVSELQKTFPHNLLNGQVHGVAGRNGKPVIQPSSLVPIK